MFAKIAILFAVLVAVNATFLNGHGVSSRSQTQDAFGNYGFSYGIQTAVGAANSRSEVGDAHGNKIGSYTLADTDGRARRVDYVADGHGFRAKVSTNEPGTAASAPAAAVINSPYAAPVASVAAHVVPLASAAHGGLIAHAPGAPATAHLAPLAPFAYGGVIAHGAALGYAPGLGLGHGLALGHGLGLVHGFGHGLKYY